MSNYNDRASVILALEDAERECTEYSEFHEGPTRKGFIRSQAEIEDVRKQMSLASTQAVSREEIAVLEGLVKGLQRRAAALPEPASADLLSVITKIEHRLLPPWE